MTCEEFEELSGAYVLDAITPQERQEAREHLAGCVKCTRRLAEMRAIADLLPLSVTQVSPPPSAKERLLAAIRQEQRIIPIERGQQMRRNRGIGGRGWSRRRLTGIVAAAVLMLALLGGMTAWNVSLQHTATSLQQQIGSLQQEINGLRPQVALSYTLASKTPSARSATGKLIYLPGQHLTVLIMQGLPQLQGTEVYQGWLIENNTHVSIGLLSVQNGIASVDFPGDITSYQTAAVSMESGPNASKNAPAGPIVAVGQLKHPLVQML